MMSRLISVLAVAALSAAVTQPAAAAPVLGDAAMAAMAADAGWMGVLQQGKGQGGGGEKARGGGGQGGGGQEARGGRAQGGGQEARGGRARGGGRQEARGGRSQGGGQRQARASSGSGNGGRGSGSAGERAKGNSSGGEARGNSGSSRSGNANARAAERGSNASTTGSERRNANATADRPSNANASGRGRSDLRGNDLQSRIAALPLGQRLMATSSRASERMAVGAIARGHARGLAADAFDVRSDNDRVRILNRRGDLLFDMDDRRAGELGGWRLRRLGDQSPRGNAPAFCRSGEGHPVWGRQWCLDKGFGLGSRSGTIWSRGGIGDIIFREPDYRTRLDRGGLLGVLGDIVLGRLALHSVSMGYDQPLTGYWVAQPEGPRLLRVRSGDYEVAEFYDADRNDRVDVLYVVQPVW